MPAATVHLADFQTSVFLCLKMLPLSPAAIRCLFFYAETVVAPCPHAVFPSSQGNSAQQPRGLNSTMWAANTYRLSPSVGKPALSLCFSRRWVAIARIFISRFSVSWKLDTAEPRPRQFSPALLVPNQGHKVHDLPFVLISSCDRTNLHFLNVRRDTIWHQNSFQKTLFLLISHESTTPTAVVYHVPHIIPFKV